MGISQQQHEFEEFQARTSAKSGVRAWNWPWSATSSTPTSVRRPNPKASATPRSTRAASPPCGPTPRTPTPTRRCSTSTSADPSPPPCTPTARRPVQGGRSHRQGRRRGFLAQATWGGPKPSGTYDGFEALARRIGHAPGRSNTDRTPLADGTYRLTAGGEVLASGADSGVSLVRGGAASWTLTATADGYYTVRAAGTDQCLDAVRGKKYLGAPLEVGAELSLGACSATARTQRWQLDPGAGAPTLRAISQLSLTRRAADGAAVQTTGATRLTAVRG